MTTETELMQRHENAISRIIGDYPTANADEVREIYLGILQN